MTFDYKRYDGLGLAELVKMKELKPSEVVEAAIQTITDINPAINAVVYTMFDQARKESDKVDVKLPFAGVPILLKNASQEIKGQPMTFGSKVLKGNLAAEDSEFVRQLRDTGMIFLGQTNVPELALMGVTEPTHYGPTRNPWNHDYTPGGSSGGSAAAVASGMVPIAGANDGGGSIRIPAAFCGLFGLKPTRGRVPIGPNRGRNWQGASVDHVLSRSVRDSAAMLDLYRLDRANAFIAPAYNGSFLEQSNTPFTKKLKIAFSTESPIGTKVDAECVEAVNKTLKLLEDLGHHVEEKMAPVDGMKLAHSYMQLYFGEVSAHLRSLEQTLGRSVKMSDVEPTTWLLGLLGKVTTAEEFVLSLKEWDQAAFKMELFHDQYDFYVTPTTAFPASKIGELDPTSFEKTIITGVSQLKLGGLLKKVGFVDQLAMKSLERTPFTQLANLTGQPSMSVPMHLTHLGLPCGVQFTAARGREDLLLQLAGTLEETDGWIKIEDHLYK